MKFHTVVFLQLAILAAGQLAGAPVTYPLISEETIRVEEVRVDENAYAAVRRPPSEGRLPAVIFLHGGLGHSNMEGLRNNSVRQPTQARFLAWGYVAVNSTRRSNRHDPQDRGLVDDVLGLLRAVRELPYVDPDSVFLYGGSGGGTLALEVASVSEDLAGVIAGEPATIIYMGMFTRDHIIVGDDGRPVKDRRWDVMNADPKKLYAPELRERTRSKLRGIDCPVLILHGDVHALKKFNLGVFVPEMRELGKDVVVKTYPGEPHGFYWGQGRDPAMALQANRDAEAFMQKHGKAAPAPVATNSLQMIEVEPMTRPDSR